MKTLSGSSFFRLFDLLLSQSNPGPNAVDWAIDDVRIRARKAQFQRP